MGNLCSSPNENNELNIPNYSVKSPYGPRN